MIQRVGYTIGRVGDPETPQPAAGDLVIFISEPEPGSDRAGLLRQVADHLNELADAQDMVRADGQG
jgi:hypothetical protein